MINKIAKTKFALMALLAMGALQSCEKDILTGQPDWLGNSIYERLQEGIDGKTFNYTVRLINDLEQTEVLAQTGSKTLFVASDEDYEEWFANNTWGISSYDDLTTSQKKQLFNGTMINNAYLIELMSNTEAETTNGDPVKGNCMRRETAASIYDNVPTMTPDEFPGNADLLTDPVNKAWAEVKAANKAIYIFEDDTPTPMIHFLPAYMQKNNIKNEDLKIISNGESDNIEDSWVSGKKVISTEQTCKNGYVYVVDGVMQTNPNMAAIVRDESKEVSTTHWANFLSRFSAPQKVEMSENDRLVLFKQHPELADKELYTLRYLNSSDNHTYSSPTGKRADNLSITLLKLDPGWNQYTASELTMKNDAAVMLVPTDDAVNTWLTEGVGGTLLKKYGTINKVDLETMAKLLNVNILGSFAASVPSKFSSIQNDAQLPLGITTDNVVRCYMGCNGVVYVVNKVFEPAEFSSVTFPALLYGGVPENSTDPSFQVIYKAMQGRVSGSTNSDYDLDFTPYLTSMDSKFGIFIPYNMIKSKGNSADIKGERVVRFIDPCSWGMENPWLYECFVDSAAKQSLNSVKGAVVAKAYKVTNIASDGTISISTSGADIQDIKSDIVADRLFDYIDNAIVVGDVNASQQYYKTKAGSTISYASGKLRGGLQMEYGYDIDIDDEFPETNGTTYGIVKDGTIDDVTMKIRIPQTPSNTVHGVLKKEVDAGSDQLFYNYIFNAPSGKELYSDKNSKFVSTTGGKNLTVFDNYNYTVYVPKDSYIQTWIDNNWLPTWSDYDNVATNYGPGTTTNLSNTQVTAIKDSIANIINNFLRYHIQDNSVYIGGNVRNNESYETGTLNPSTKRFYTLSVTTDATSGSVKGNGNTSAITIATDFFNKPAREIWIELPGSATSLTANNVDDSTIAASSYIVVHKIEGTLCYDSALQQQQWWDRLGLPTPTVR